jgi:iron complex transport system permease protein
MFIGAILLVRRMRLLEMGDDSACALGVGVERSRLMLMLVAVLLTAAATAIAGRSHLSPSWLPILRDASAGRRAGVNPGGAVRRAATGPISAPSGCLCLINCRWAW